MRSALIAAVCAALVAAALALRPGETGDDTALAAQAWAQQRSDVWIEVVGTVRKVLPDDLRGSRHQRFIIELANGQTLLVAHNIDLAPRIEGLAVGDTVRVRGEYEWNERGGVLHWTHHDPDGRRAGGFVEHRGRRYR